MGRLEIYRRKGSELMPVLIEISNEKFAIQWGERKELKLPAGRYTLTADGWFGFKGSKEIEIEENASTTLLLTQILPSEILIIAIIILSFLLVLAYMGVISNLSFIMSVFSCNAFSILYPIINRKKYFQFKDKSR